MQNTSSSLNMEKPGSNVFVVLHYQLYQLRSRPLPVQGQVDKLQFGEILQILSVHRRDSGDIVPIQERFYRACLFAVLKKNTAFYAIVLQNIAIYCKTLHFTLKYCKTLQYSGRLFPLQIHRNCQYKLKDC